MESHIRQSLLSVNHSSTTTGLEVNKFLEKLEDWKACIPMGDIFPHPYLEGGDPYDTHVSLRTYYDVSNIRL